MKKNVIAILAITLSLCSSARAATISIFTERSAWEAKVNGTFIEETFTAPPLQTGLAFSRGIAYYPGGYYLDDLVKGQSTTWHYGSGFYGFGATWNISYDNKGTGLLLTALWEGGGNQPINTEVSDGFFGIFSTDQLLTGIRVDIGPNLGLGERYTLDNVVISDAAPSGNVVPEPSTLLLCGIGITAAALIRGRKK